LIDQFVGVAHGDFIQVQELLERHSGLLNANATWNETAIQAATQTGQVEIAEYLLAKGAPLDICTAAMLGKAAQVEETLRSDPGQAEATGAHGLPVLFFPVITAHKGIAETLLAHGARIDAGQGFNTPLHGAVLFGQTEMVTWLLDHGASVQVLDYNGKTPLQLAEDSGQAEIAGLLRKAEPPG
jgi:ankyrin repeat protein